MKKENLYTYLGTNGTVITPVCIEGIPSIKKIRLTADDKKVLTKDYGTTYVFSVIVPELDVDNWLEIDYPGQNEL